MRDRSVATKALVSLAVVLALVGAACAKKAATGAGSTPTASGGGGGLYGGGSTPTPSASPTGGGGPVAATLTQANYMFTPSKLTVKSGDAIEVKNSNPTTPHTFTVTGQTIDITNDAAQSQTVTIDLPPGTYAFVCRFHEGLGMKGTLTVT